MFKKLTVAILLILFTASCADTVDSVKRGLTGAKSNSADEFLVKKKDPLILPPDFENLPTPDENAVSADEISIFVDMDFSGKEEKRKKRKKRKNKKNDE